MPYLPQLDTSGLCVGGQLSTHDSPLHATHRGKNGEVKGTMQAFSGYTVHQLHRTPKG